MPDPYSMETAARTIEVLTDAHTFIAADDTARSRDPLRWPGYARALQIAAERSRNKESLVSGAAALAGSKFELAVFDFSFIAGSMGEVAGERLARALERAVEKRTPFVLVTSTGGARVQEGMVSLIQMPKVVAARVELANANVPLIAVLQNPTTGGVLASIAGLADIAAAVQGAILGFAGPRVVERFTGSPVANTSHTARSAFVCGLVDALIAPDERREWLHTVLSTFAADRPQPAPPPNSASPAQAEMDSWESVESARSPERPTGPQLARTVSDGIVEIRGDRAGGDDQALFAAVGRMAGRRVIVLAFDRRLAPGPRAFRKATRALRLAGRLALPVVTIIDTRGADPSSASEGGGIAWAIAEALEAIMSAPVPVVAVVTGEGGSGGALALAAGDVLLAYESSIFSVIDPEAAAEILWRDGGRAKEAAELLKPRASDLLGLGIADDLLAEPLNSETLGRAVAYHLELLSTDGRSGAERARSRRKRWRGSLGP
jgi:acyl-CoA carboxylase subunit beta